MEPSTIFLIIVAGICGLLVSGIPRLQIPSGVAQILMGVVIGKSGFGLINTGDPVLHEFSNIGFTLLMFLVAIGLPFHQPGLKNILWHAFGATALAFLATPIAFALAHFTPLHNTPIYVLLLAASSTAVVMPMIMERKLAGPLVVVITAWVALSDVTPVVLLPLAVYPGKLVMILIGAAVISLIALACSFGLRWWQGSRIGKYYRRLSKERGWALDLRMGEGILFALTVVASHFGTGALVPGFAAGAIIAANHVPPRFTKQLRGLAEGFFVPFFLVVFGAKLDFTALFTDWHALIITVSIVFGSMAVHFIVAMIMRLPWPAALMASSQQGLPIALVSMGLSEHLFGPAEGAAIILVTLILIGMAAIGTSRLARLSPGVEIAAEKKPGKKAGKNKDLPDETSKPCDCAAATPAAPSAERDPEGTEPKL